MRDLFAKGPKTEGGGLGKKKKKRRKSRTTRGNKARRRSKSSKRGSSSSSKAPRSVHPIIQQPFYPAGRGLSPRFTETDPLLTKRLSARDRPNPRSTKSPRRLRDGGGRSSSRSSGSRREGKRRSRSRSQGSLRGGEAGRRDGRRSRGRSRGRGRHGSSSLASFRSVSDAKRAQVKNHTPANPPAH